MYRTKLKLIPIKRSRIRNYRVSIINTMIYYWSSVKVDGKVYYNYCESRLGKESKEYNRSGSNSYNQSIIKCIV